MERGSHAGRGKAGMGLACAHGGQPQVSLPGVVAHMTHVGHDRLCMLHRLCMLQVVAWHLLVHAAPAMLLHSVYARHDSALGFR